jgi:hypothetical protein
VPAFFHSHMKAPKAISLKPSALISLSATTDQTKSLSLKYFLLLFPYLRTILDFVRFLGAHPCKSHPAQIVLEPVAVLIQRERELSVTTNKDACPIHESHALAEWHVSAVQRSRSGRSPPNWQRRVRRPLGVELSSRWAR